MEYLYGSASAAAIHVWQEEDNHYGRNALLYISEEDDDAIPFGEFKILDYDENGEEIVLETKFVIGDVNEYHYDIISYLEGDYEKRVDRGQIQGRLWCDHKAISFYDDCDYDWPNDKKMKEVLLQLKETFPDIQTYTAYKDTNDIGVVQAIPVSSYFQNSPNITNVRNRTDFALAKEKGRTDLRNAEMNDPRLDKMYRNVVEHKKSNKKLVLNEKQKRMLMINECIEEILKGGE